MRVYPKGLLVFAAFAALTVALDVRFGIAAAVVAMVGIELSMMLGIAGWGRTRD